MSANSEIRQAIDRFATAYRSGDLDSLLAYYSEDLIKDRAGAPSEHKPETAERIREVFATHATDIVVTVDEIVSSGDLAFVRGSFVIKLASRSEGVSSRSLGATWKSGVRNLRAGVYSAPWTTKSHARRRPQARRAHRTFIAGTARTGGDRLIRIRPR